MIVEPSLKLLMCEEKATNTEMHKSLFFLSFLQVMFEKYQFDSVHIAIQAVLTLYAQGKRVHSRKNHSGCVRRTGCCVAEHA